MSASGQLVQTWAQDLNPVSYPVTGVRGMMYGAASFGDIARVFVLAAVLTGVLAPITMSLYRDKT